MEVPEPRTAELIIVETSPGHLSYRLMDQGRVVWSNRPYPTPAGDAGARGRMAAWAAEHGYRVVEKGGVIEQQEQRRRVG